MKIIRNRIIPFGKYGAINLFGMVFAKKDMKMDEVVINHERIHTHQMRELGYIFFYIIYVAEWLWRLCKSGDAYRNLSFEREAYDHQSDLNYLKNRKPFAQWRLRSSRPKDI